MTVISSLYRSDDAQLMKITDKDTGLPLENENGDEMGIWLNNLKCDACKKVVAKFQNRHKKRDASLSEREQFSVDLLEAATTGFENLQLVEGGDVVEYSPELAQDIYRKSDIIRKQVDEFLGADESFLAKALAS